MRTHTLIATLLLAAPVAAMAQGSLADKRLAITKGTSPGKVLIEAPSTVARPAVAASAPAPAPGASAPARQGWLDRLPPPSGRPLNQTRRLDATDLGIAVNRGAPAASAPR